MTSTRYLYAILSISYNAKHRVPYLCSAMIQTPFAIFHSSNIKDLYGLRLFPEQLNKLSGLGCGVIP
jgi:hypothetical protein